MSPLSLQAHVVSLPSAPRAIAVDPRGFKTALQSFIQFLITHQVRATLWLKLPKDDAWWQDIWQYAQQAVGCTIYSLGEQTGNPPDTLAASLRPIPIEQTAELKREYLCLAVCDQFVGALVAARVSPRTTVSDKRTLQLYGSASLSTIAALSTGIKAIIESNLPSKALESQSASTLALELAGEKAIAGAAALSQWDRYFPASLWTLGTLPLSEAFLSWQMHSQEELRSRLNDTHSAPSKTPKGAENNPTSHTISADFLRQAREELQSPLTTIKTALTLLGSPTLKLTQRQRYVEMIATQCNRQKDLVNSIIELLEIQTTQAQPPHSIDLSELLPGIVSIYQPIAQERDILLTYTISDQLRAVLGVEAQLKQVVIRLIKNGIQRTHKKGRIWVSAMPEGDRFVALTIQDSGSYISKSEISRLFEAFHSSADSDKANLELTLAQQLVQRMGGRIVVESSLEDTLFKILLPVQPMSSTQPVSPRPAHSIGHSIDRLEGSSIEKERTTDLPSTGRQTPVFVS
ncbi:MAG: DICT sensory domain-containing protein [Phormidesmis sp.]